MSLVPQPKSQFLTKVTKADLARSQEEMPLVDKLFRRKFAVFVPAAYLYSEEDFARGVAVTGDKDRDRRAAQEPEQVFIPIAPDDDHPGPNILEFFEQDIPCNFRYEKDVVTVYNILMEHFRVMAAEINQNPLMSKEKRERIMTDLTRFDALASKLHGSTHELLPKHLGGNTLEHKLRMLLKPKMGSEGTLTPTEPENTVPEYQPFSTGISRQILKGGGKNKWR